MPRRQSMSQPAPLALRPYLIKLMLALASTAVVACQSPVAPPMPADGTATPTSVDPKKPPSIGVAPDGAGATFDAAMLVALGHYVAIQESLAADTIDTLGPMAAKLCDALTAAGHLNVDGVDADTLRAVPALASPACSALQAAPDISTARNHFWGVSKAIAPWLNARRPTGFDLVWCSMYPGGWAQRSGPIRNPYFGAAMLTCGEKASVPAP